MPKKIHKHKHLNNVKPCRKTKDYKKHGLKKRIARVMRFSNTISVVLLLAAMIFVIGALVSIMGMGFSMYTAGQIAEEVQESYDMLEDKDDFVDLIKMESMDDNEGLMTDEMKEIYLEMADAKDQHLIQSDVEFLSTITYFEYKIFYDDRIIYDSFEQSRQMTAMDKYNNDNMMSKKLFTEAEVPFLDDNGDEIGRVAVRISPDITGMVYFASFILVVIIFCSNLIISKIITAITSKMVAKPLETLAEQMETMANEELEDAFNMTLDVKRPVSEIKSLTGSTDKIMKKMAHYYELMMAQNQELEAQRDTLEYQRDELEAQTEELEAQKDELESQNVTLTETGSSLQSMNNAYLSRTLKLQNLLDNVGQGFLTFGSDLTINSEYSVACTDMLCEVDCDEEGHPMHDHHHDITGMNVVDLLVADPEQREFIESLFLKVLEGSEHERNLFVPLLPEELELKGRIQSVEYKIVKDEHFKEQMMVILTDITMRRELEEQMEVERDILQMIVKVLLNRDGFLSTIEEFGNYLDSGVGSFTQDDYEDALRAIHTFKGGSFAQYYLNNTSQYLNDLEDIIYKDGTIEAVKSIDTDLVRTKLQEDLTIIEGYVGNDFIYKKDLYTVNEDKIIEIEQKKSRKYCQRRSLRKSFQLSKVSDTGLLRKGLSHTQIT